VRRKQEADARISAALLLTLVMCCDSQCDRWP